ncbi:MAG: hypothetical protein K6T88_21115 [Bacillus sp. (in: Bacteria)]|nr:hypothetical protein [Bacillus sp. (in: firmicutes)]
MKVPSGLFGYFDRFVYKHEQTSNSYLKAIVYFSLIPLIIISLNEHNVYSPGYLTLICIAFGHRDIRPFMQFKQYPFGKLIKISVFLFGVSMIFSFITLKIMNFFGVQDPQGIRNMVLSDEEYLQHLLRLPFVAMGEEFFKFLIFISFFIQLSQFSKHIKIFIAIILASFIFGHLHIFGYDKLSAGLPIMMGAIPGFYYMLYYRNILPLIFEHFFFDFASVTLHTQYQSIFLALFTLFIMVVVIWNVFREVIKPNTNI